MTGKVNQKPTYLRVIPENIPKELKELDQWVVWRGERRGGKNGKPGKWTKPPFNPITGGDAKVNKPETWAPFEDALKAYQGGGYDGIGFVLTKDTGMVGIDRDHCLSCDGRYKDDTDQALIESLKTYTEVSPSNDGIRVLAFSELPPEGRKKGDWEMYDSDRYLTITGNKISNGAGIENRPDEILKLHRVIWPKPSKTKSKPTRPVDLSDQEILDRAFQRKNGDKIRALYHGSTDGYPSQSEADQALCNHLAFWFGKDAGRMDAVFRSSELMRDKWDRKTAGSTYGMITIQKAIDQTGDTYTAPRNRDQAQGGRGEAFKTKELEEKSMPDVVFHSLADLQHEEFPEVQWIVPDIIPEGCTLLSGKPKAGKSIMALNIGIAKATGGNALGKKVDPGTVLYLALEDNKRRMQRRTSEMMTEGLQWPENFKYCTEFPGMNDGGIERLEAAIESEKPALVVIDTVKAFSGAKKGGGTLYDQDYECFSQIQRLSSRTNTAIILVHHVRKSESEDIFDTVSGSFGINGAVDTLAVLSWKNGGYCLSIRGRDVDEAELALKRDAQRKLWVLLGDAHEIKSTKERQIVYDLFRDNPGIPFSPKKIAELTGLKTSYIYQKALPALSQAGDLMKIGRGEYIFSGVDSTARMDSMDSMDSMDRKIRNTKTSYPAATMDRKADSFTDDESPTESGAILANVAKLSKLSKLSGDEKNTDPPDCELCTERNNTSCKATGKGMIYPYPKPPACEHFKRKVTA